MSQTTWGSMRAGFVAMAMAVCLLCAPCAFAYAVGEEDLDVETVPVGEVVTPADEEGVPEVASEDSGKQSDAIDEEAVSGGGSTDLDSPDEDAQEPEVSVAADEPAEMQEQPEPKTETSAVTEQEAGKQESKQVAEPQPVVTKQSVENKAQVQEKKPVNNAPTKVTVQSQGTKVTTTKPKAETKPSIAGGIFAIAAYGASGQVVDISGGTKGNGGNALMWQQASGKQWQKWQFVWKGGNTFEIVNLNSGKLLDVEGAAKRAGANVLQWQRNGGQNQLWVVTLSADKKYYTIKSALGNYYLDMTGATSKNGTNIEIWTPNTTSAQKFVLKAVQALDAGVYEIDSALGGGEVMDVPGLSTAKGTQLTTWKANDGTNQRFYVRNEAGGSYSIQNVNSGMFLTASNGKVVQQPWSGAKTQLWSAGYESGIAFKNLQDGKRLAVSGGKAVNGAKLVTANSANTAAQHWSVTSKQLIPSGYYMMRNGVGTYLDVTGAAFKDGANMETWTKNSSGAQCFKVETVGDSYRFVNTRSWKAVDVSGKSKADGGNVIQWATNGGSNQLWRATMDRNGYIVFTNVNSGKALDVSGASAKAGANVLQWRVNGGKNQAWKLEPVARYSISGNETLDRRIASVLSTHGSLRSAYNYVSNFSYREGNRHWSGGKYLPNSTTVSYANDMYSHRSGNCYRFASLFSWLARGLGYSTNVCNGWVSSVSGGRAPHGWVEVYSGGTKVCDPDMYNAIRGRNWYMQTYASAPIDYHFW